MQQPKGKQHWLQCTSKCGTCLPRKKGKRSSRWNMSWWLVKINWATWQTGWAWTLRLCKEPRKILTVNWVSPRACPSCRWEQLSKLETPYWSKMFWKSNVYLFSQTLFVVPGVVKFEPHMPKINLDSPKVKARQAFADRLKNLFQEPVDVRLSKLKSGYWTVSL